MNIAFIKNINRYCKPLLAACLLFAAHAPLSAAEGPTFLGLSRSQGKTIVNDTSYSSVDLLSFPVIELDLLPFLNFQAHYFDKGHGCAANLGGGLRYAATTSGIIYGANTYYDYRQAHGKSFSQLGLGLEALGDRFNFRLNGYLPVGKQTKLVSSCFFNGYIGNYFYGENHFLKSRGGADFEAEAWLKKTSWGGVRLGLGTYYFKGTKCGHKILGTSYRATADVTDYFRIGLLGSHDGVFGTRFEAQLTVILPLGGDGTFSQQGLFQSVQRNPFILLQKRSCAFANF